MHFSILAHSEEQMTALKAAVLATTQSVAETKAPPVSAHVGYGSNSGLSACFEFHADPSEAPPVPKVTIVKDHHQGLLAIPELTIEGTIHTENILLSGVPEHVTHTDIKTALQSISLILTDENQVMDLDMASIKYGRAFALQQSCEMTGESFDDLCDKFPFLKDEATRSGVLGEKRRPGSNDGR